MSGVKKIAGSLIGLLLALIILMLVLRLLGNVPIIGGIANDAKNLATSGSIAG